MSLPSSHWGNHDALPSSHKKKAYQHQIHFGVPIYLFSRTVYCYSRMKLHYGQFSLVCAWMLIAPLNKNKIVFFEKDQIYLALSL